MEEEDHVKDQSVDGWVIFRLILRNRSEGVDQIQLVPDRMQ
jgi:hypothetical protein